MSICIFNAPILLNPSIPEVCVDLLHVCNLLDVNLDNPSISTDCPIFHFMLKTSVLLQQKRFTHSLQTKFPD